MIEELKPCPFDNGKPELIVKYEWDSCGARYTAFVVICSTCGCCGKTVFTSDREPINPYIEEAVESWNKRQEPNNIATVSVQLRKFIEHQETFQPEVARILRDNFWDLLA